MNMPAVKSEIEKRVVAFTMFRNHVSDAQICKLLCVSKLVFGKWKREDDWETRRAVFLQTEVVPGWAQDLFELLVVQNRRLVRLEAHLETLVARTVPAASPTSSS